ncbi:MAG: 3-hydroxyacyl-CoA dehydrogenase NAD-binding domain-containing protein [Chloroflexota bacterium]|nr:3-hydroxyacyl-CoA dehydrogenase NAD-binding domain-containing protein [Chloroflexota bacterium]
MGKAPRAHIDGPAIIGVVGAGTMGAGIAQVALEAGQRVLIHDPDPAAVARARERIADGIARRARRRSPTNDVVVERTVAEAVGRLEASAALEHLAGAADVVIEAVLEDLALKRSIFTVLDAAARPGSILATNTSALSVAAIAGATLHPARVIGLHFFNPAPVMALVEVVAPSSADPGVVRAATELVEAWGKTTVRTADSPGFIVNRVNRPFTLEALALLEAGIGSVESIDAAVRAAGYPMGPFELMDLIGIDVNLAAARGIYQAFRYEPRFRPSPIQERLVEAGRLGRKSREGFYWYGEDGRSLGQAGAFAAEPAGDGLASGVLALPVGGADHDPVGSNPVLSDPIAERIVLAIVNEAHRALGDGVASAADIDLALRLGAGHPDGPFERTAALGGPAAVVARLERWRSAGARFVPAPSLIEAARVVE